MDVDDTKDAEYECGHWLGLVGREDAPDDCPQCGAHLDSVYE